MWPVCPLAPLAFKAALIWVKRNREPRGETKKKEREIERLNGDSLSNCWPVWSWKWPVSRPSGSKIALQFAREFIRCSFLSLSLSLSSSCCSFVYSNLPLTQTYVDSFLPSPALALFGACERPACLLCLLSSRETKKDRPLIQ